MRVDKEYLNNALNDKQYEAAITTEGPVLVFAGAGSGKTRVVTHRIAYLIDNNFAMPQEILAVTFTNKAAAEMRERVEKMLNFPSRGLYIQTFHSLGARVLRQHADKIGFKDNFTILDSNDQQSFIKHLMKEWGWDSKSTDPKSILGGIELLKREAMLPGDFRPSFKEWEQKLKFAYENYQKELKRNNCMDFSDLLLYFVHLLKTSQEVRESYCKLWKYIMVDEFQDTNTIQFELVKILGAKHQNVFAVGDDDQSIYSFRGAQVGNILEFSKIFKGAQVILLEQNYRSSGNIIEASSALIGENTQRAPKTLWTSNEPGDKITVRECTDEKEEAYLVAQKAKDWVSSGTHPEEVAIFYRTNAQGRSLEDSFRTNEIPYRIIGGFSFYKRKEIKDFLSILNLIYNPASDIDFMRACLNPPRGLGETSISKLKARCQEIGLSMGEYILKARQDLSLPKLKGKQQLVLDAVADLIQEFSGKDQIELCQIYDRIIEKIPFEAYFKKSGKPEDLGRLENILEFRSVLWENDQKGYSLSEFLEYMALVTTQDEDDGEEKVTLMTVHASKGLEFEKVAISGLEDGLFPQQYYMAEQTEEQVEEERRLFYVALTRAKQSLHLSFAAARLLYGQTQYKPMSRFIRELPQNLLDKHYVRGAYGSNSIRPGYKPQYGNNNNDQFLKTGARDQLIQADTPTKLVGGPPVPNYSFKQSNDAFNPGDNVSHQKFGGGRVLAVDGNRVRVQFGDGNTRTLVASFLQKAF